MPPMPGPDQAAPARCDCGADQARLDHARALVKDRVNRIKDPYTRFFYWQGVADVLDVMSDDGPLEAVPAPRRD